MRPPMAANATRTIEWEKIGTEWKKLMEGDNAAGVDTAAVGKGKGSGSCSRPAPRDRNSGGDDLHIRIEEIKKRTEESDEERGGRKEERQDAIPDLATLGEFLDKTRDMVNERMKEVKGDEEKLAKARKAYPKIAEQVKKKLEEARNEDGEVDPKVLLSVIPKEGQESLKGGIKASKDGIKRRKSGVDDGEGRDQGIEIGKEGVRRGLEEMKKYTGKGGDGHNPEQAFPRKRGAKL